MSIYKGYTNSNKENRIIAEYVTISPIAPDKYGLDLSTQKGVTLVASDAADAGTTNQIITAASHVANVGDMIRFTSGGCAGYEAVVVAKATNTITLGQTLPATPAALDTFNIYRSITQTLTATGTMPATLSFTRNGAAQDIVEDTVTPANNRPLPVRLMDFNGEMTLNAANLDLNVQLTHAGANPDSVQIGNGTNIADVNAGKELLVKDTTADTSLGTIAGAVSGTEMQVDVVAALPAGTNNIGDVDVASIAAGTNLIGKVGISDGTHEVDINASNEMLVKDATSNTSLGTIAGAVAGTEMQVDIVAALPAGTNNIGDVDVATLPSLAAGSNLIGTVGLNDGTHSADINASNELLVKDTTADSSLSSIDGKITACNTGAVTISAALPAGTNNIGDVDVATLPSLAAGSNLIGTVGLNDGTHSADINASNELLVKDTTADSSLSSIDGKITACNTGSVTIGAALPAGTNNIGDVDVASIAAGTNYIGKIRLTDGTHDGVLSVDGYVEAILMSNVTVNSLDIKNTAYVDFSSSNLPGNATNPVQLVASLSADIKAIQVFDTGGAYMEVMTGAAASEVRKFLVGPGSNETIQCAITSGTRVAVRRIDSASALAVGGIAVNFLG